MIEELQKKVVGCQNPLNVSYRKQEEKPSYSQSDLRLWINKKEALHNARRQRYSSEELKYIIENLQIIHRKVETGYLHKD